MKRNSRTVLLQTARAVAYNEANNRSIPVRVLFDNGSQRSYITDHIRSRLGLAPVSKERLKLNTFGESRYKTQSCEVVKLDLKKPGFDKTVTINALSFPVLCLPLPSRINIDCPHLEGLDLADDWDQTDGSIDLLVGSDHYWDIVTGETRTGENGPVAVKSSLGWLLSGPATGTSKNMGAHSNLIISRPAEAYDISTNETNLVKTIEKFWNTESIGIKEPNPDNEESFITNVSCKNGRYEVTLPWKEERPSDHYNLSYNRVKSLQRRLLNDHDLLTEYDQIIKDQLDAGIIEKIPQEEINRSENVHYMPHHGVVRKDRVVFDGSAKSDDEGLSINDCLNPGPNLIPKLLDVLVKFRYHPVALSADIEKAFLMISVNESDRDMLRFLWFEEPHNPNSGIIHLRFTRLVFGLRPSPAILNSTIREHLSKYKNVYPDIVQQVEDSLYVDDLVSGSENDDAGFELYETAKKVMAEGSFNLRKWRSNSAALMNRIKEIEVGIENECRTVNHEVKATTIQEDDDTYTKSTIVSGDGSRDEKTVKLLGVGWNCESDDLFFNIQDLIEFAKNLPVTKRSFLRLTAKILDPLGMLSPFIVQVKYLFQVICQEKKDWNEPLHGDLLKEWNTIVNGLPALNAIRISRCYFLVHMQPEMTELHAFSDASNKAYAAVIYMRSIYENGQSLVRFVASKTRVAPLKTQTIPRLELLGAVILARLVSTVVKSLPCDISVTYWVDSTTVLYWIKNERPWKQYVNHRVNEMRQLTNKNDWRFCPGQENPADLATRGLSGEELLNNSLWWEGPEFLACSKDQWPKCPASASGEESAVVELVKNPAQECHSLLTKEQEMTSEMDITQIIDCCAFSSITRLLRVTAYVLRFTRILRKKVNGTHRQEVLGNELSASEIDESEALWIRTVQNLSFESEMKYLHGNQRSSPPELISQFGLFLDKKAIIRCKGRINESSLPEMTKNPVLLPSKHCFSNLVIRDTHERIKHSGLRDTLSTIRERFWILKGREAVKRCIRQCVVCRKVEGKTYWIPACIPDLPSYRVSEDPPFSHTGLDFAGPLYIKPTHEKQDQTANSEATKAYILLMTCASTRAIHLELTRGLSVPAFLLAFRRFVSRRGLPATLISDNAKTFKSASNELKKVVRSEEVLRYLATNRVTWKFIADRAPWWGGFWERMVKTVKQSLKKSIGRATLSYDELNTILTEVESIINARPLTYVYDDTESISYPLTPSHLISGRRITNMANSSHFEVVSTNNSLTRRSKHHRALLRHFTNDWRRNYLLNLREN